MRLLAATWVAVLLLGGTAQAQDDENSAPSRSTNSCGSVSFLTEERPIYYADVLGEVDGQTALDELIAYQAGLKRFLDENLTPYRLRLIEEVYVHLPRTTLQGALAVYEGRYSLDQYAEFMSWVQDERAITQELGFSNYTSALLEYEKQVAEVNLLYSFQSLWQDTHEDSK